MSYIKMIPGFRSGVLWKKLIAISGYILLVMFLFIDTTVSVGDYLLSFLERFLVLSVPYILVFNVGGIRDKLPFGKSKNKKISFLGAVLFSALWLIPAFTFYGVAEDCLHSPAYKTAMAQYDKQQEATKAQKLLLKQQTASLKAKQDEAESKANAETKAKSESKFKAIVSPVTSRAPSSKSSVSSPPESKSAVSSRVSSVTAVSSYTFKSIGGSNDISIIENLKKWGLTPKSSIPEDGSGILCTATAVDPDTGATLSYSMDSEDDSSIVGVTFSVLNSASIDKQSFLTLCDGFLSYCATLNYDTANQQKAKSWVSSNMNTTNKPGKPITVTIGDAQFSLSGNGSLSRELEVEKAK